MKFRWYRLSIATLLVAFAAGLGLALAEKPATNRAAKPQERLYLDPIDVNPLPITADKSVKYDYDIVYVRAPRRGDKGRTMWTEISHPALIDAGADLMLLHPDGSEERLVAGGEDASVTDPFVSFDGEWVYYSHIRGLKGTSQHGQPPFGGADIYKIHVNRSSARFYRVRERPTPSIFRRSFRTVTSSPRNTTTKTTADSARISSCRCSRWTSAGNSITKPRKCEKSKKIMQSILSCFHSFVFS